MKNFREYIEREEEIFGWLSPSGRFYRCGMFGHSAVVLKDPELKKHLSKETLKVVDQQIYEDEADPEISNNMYKAGFLRVGSVPTILDSDIIFEGTPETIKNLYNKAKNMAEQYGRKATFSPRKV